MSWAGMQMTDPGTQAERRREVSRLVLLTSLRQRKLEEQPGYFDVRGVSVEVVICDGSMMMARWWHDGRTESFPLHTHRGAHETVGVTRGYARFVLDNGTEMELLGDGSSVYVPPGVGHMVHWKPGVPSEGWLIAVPPDEGLLPINEHGVCLLDGTSKCAGSGRCAMRFFTGGGDARPGGT
jgi:quercetin dioxygenase-like cupin family protein